MLVSMNLLESTKQLLSETDQSISYVAKQSSVGSRWLQFFVAGRFKDPGVTRVQRVYDYLIVQSQLDSDSDESSKDKEAA